MNYHNNTLPELLAPAGSFEHLKAAVLAGADAVYFGGSRFGARAYAENFTKDKVIEGLDYVHFHDRRAYMTVNTLMKEKELQESLYEYLLPFYEAGLDGVIVQDLGAASFIRDHFPEMEVHASTQMMITSLSGALEAKNMGMNRIVPARELSMEEVARIKKETGLEIEVFIHGALCYCYSGQCLFSSMYGGRSGNRGRCAQPCRLPYRYYDCQGNLVNTKEKHLLSPKDLCSLHTLPSMIENGVDSLKIEGRMKNVDYVAGVTSIYRKYLDHYAQSDRYSVDAADEDILNELYARSGFTKGYWINHNGKDMMSIDSPRHLGLEIGSVLSLKKNKLLIHLNHQVHSKDLLVIPGEKEEELVLTIPSDLSSILQKRKKGWDILLNVPKTPWLKAGLPVHRRHNEELKASIQNDILAKKITYPVTGTMKIQEEQPMVLTLESRGDQVTLTAEPPIPAQKRPIEEKDILKQMNKTGNVPFQLTDFDLSMDTNLFVQASLLKDLRRQAYEALEQKHKKRLYRKNPAIDTQSNVHQTGSKKEDCNNCFEIEKKEFLACVYNEANLQYCLDQGFFHGIVLSMDFYDAPTLREKKALIHEKHTKAYLSLPRVLRLESASSMEDFLKETMSDGEKWDGIYINNINELSIFNDISMDIPRIYGASLYQWNHNSREEIKRLQREFQGQSYFDLPMELSANECFDSLQADKYFEDHSNSFPLECLIYGRFPVMLSAQCLKKTLGRCNHTREISSLEDRHKRKLPVSCHCDPSWTDFSLFRSKRTALSCYNMIWTDQPRNLMGENYKELSSYTKRFRFDFFLSNPAEIHQVIKDFQKWEKESYQESSLKKSSEDHWNIGIE